MYVKGTKSFSPKMSISWVEEKYKQQNNFFQFLLSISDDLGNNTG